MLRRSITSIQALTHEHRIAIRGFASANPSTRKLLSTPKAKPPASPKQQQHADLPSFLEYAQRVGLDETSPTFTGTRYEYLVAARLARYGFSLTRVGGASDFGIDLLGEWTIPTTCQTIRVLIQCKAGTRGKGGPLFIRELEGSFIGAPPGWRGPGVLGLLVAERRATKGVRDALGRSRLPMGYFCCEGRDGEVRQMLWNQRAAEEGLEGVDVAVRRGGEDEVVLVKGGEPLPLLDE